MLELYGTRNTADSLTKMQVRFPSVTDHVPLFVCGGFGLGEVIMPGVVDSVTVVGISVVVVSVVVSLKNGVVVVDLGASVVVLFLKLLD